MDERDDDFELKIVNLDDCELFDEESENEESIFHALSTRQTTSSSSNNSSPLAPRFTLRQRRRQLIATVAIVGLLLFVLLSSYSPTRNQLIQALIPSSPTTNALDEPSSNFFYFDAEPIWGQLFIDGKLIAHPPRNPNEAPLQLSQGHHMIRWQAQPFVTQLCGVSVPYNIITDTCHLNQFIHSTRGVGAWLFSFATSLAQLPRSSFTALVTTVQSTLNVQAPTETVLPGELYGTNSTHLPTQQRKEPLKATLHYQLDVENNLDSVCSTVLEASTACTFNGQACYLFCTIPVSLMSASVEQAWYVFAAAQATWEYTTINGRIVAQHQPELVGTTTLYDHLLPLRILWNGTQWNVKLLSLPVSSDMSLQFNEPCNTALNAVRNVLFPPPAAFTHVGINWLYASNTNPASGCLAMATIGQYAISPPPIVYFLYRFGVFLAANDVAHKYWPTMPFANASEQQLAQQLATTLL